MLTRHLSINCQLFCPYFSSCHCTPVLGATHYPPQGKGDSRATLGEDGSFSRTAQERHAPRLGNYRAEGNTPAPASSGRTKRLEWETTPRREKNVEKQSRKCDRGQLAPANASLQAQRRPVARECEIVYGFSR